MANVTATHSSKVLLNSLNPYDPKPYSRWTMRGMIDLDNELKVAEEFWDFLGGKGAFTDLLSIFEKVGLDLRVEIDAYFSRYNK